MKKTEATKFLVGVLFIIGFFSLAPPKAYAAYTGTIIDNFDGPSLNYRLWQPYSHCPQLQQWVQQGGELRIRIDGAYTDEDGTGVNSNFLFKGDFDMTVDYRLITWPGANGVGLGFEDLNFLLHRRSGGEGLPTERYKIMFQDGGIFYGSVLPATDQEGQSGKLRLIREGSVLKGYFYQNNIWQLVDSHDFSAMTEWVAVSLNANTGSNIFAGKTVEIAFDNFQLSYSQIKFKSNLSPLFLLLMD